MIGRALAGTYRVLDLVGGGGFADVYLARELRTNSVVAVKVLHAGFAAQPDVVRRFLQEARTAQALQSPHIVRILDAGVDNGTYYIVMEYVHGHTLAHILRTRGALPIPEAVGYARQILLALEAAHKAGIIHRDIKPQNIMVTPDGTVKVMDFGIAKHAAAGTMTQTGMYLGTPQYMSPEQARGEKVDARSDLYSLAIVLYEMLGGGPPFDAESPWQVLKMQAEQDPPALGSLRSDLPPWLVRAVSNGLEKRPERRFQSGLEMLEALGDGPSAPRDAGVRVSKTATPLAETASGRPASPGGSRFRPRRKPPLFFGLGLVVLVILVAVLWPPPPPPPSLCQPGRIAYQSTQDGNWEIYTMDTDGSGLARLTDHPAADEWPSWSPDGRRIAFQSDRDGNSEIYVMNADGSEQTRLTHNPGFDGQPSWSPDGQRILFASGRYRGTVDIYAMKPDGTDQGAVTDDHWVNDVPRWSPDGKHVAFASNRDGNTEIYVMNPDGSEQTALTNNSAWDYLPAWSPDGRRIAFASNNDGSDNVYVMDADGGNRVQLTNSDRYGSLAPAWSPDGRRIAFVAYQYGSHGKRELYTMNADGTGQARLTTSAYEADHPSWTCN